MINVFKINITGIGFFFSLYISEIIRLHVQTASSYTGIMLVCFTVHIYVTSPLV